MNIYLFELKRLSKSLVVWAVCIAGILILLMKGFYPAMMESKAEVAALFANFPPEFMAVLGLDIDKMFSYEGFYLFSFTYVGLASAIMAVSLALQCFAREKRGKCTDFILTKPVNRRGVYGAKYLACITVLLLFNLFYVAIIAPDYISKTVNFQLNGSFVLFMLSPLLTQLIFLSLGIIYAIFSKRVRSISGTATAFGFAAFLLSGVAEILEKETLNLIAPLKYFDPKFVADTGTFDPKLLAAAVIVFAGCTAAAFIRYCRQDIAAV
ncbi:MAG: ABC transporter permease subunit [Oscillospiraceae bacterium]